MGFNLIYWTLIYVNGLWFLMGSDLEKKNGKITKKGHFFSSGYGCIGEIPHGLIWPDWGP